MIKKLLLLLTSVFLFGCYSFGQACIPDPQYTNTSTQSGVYPDSATNFDTAYVGIPYTQLVTIVVPPDTTVSPFPMPFTWDSTVLVNVTGLPASISYACWNTSNKPNRCSWKGNSIGCSIVTGTPVLADVGVHSLVFNTNNYLAGVTSPNPYPITYYELVVMSAPNAINENPKIQTLLQNNPNPFNNKSEIQFTAEENGIAQFKIYNLIGTVIQNYDIRVKKGINKLELDSKDFNSGIYFYSLIYGSNAFTRKMVVNK